MLKRLSLEALIPQDLTSGTQSACQQLLLSSVKAHFHPTSGVSLQMEDHTPHIPKKEQNETRVLTQVDDAMVEELSA